MGETSGTCFLCSGEAKVELPTAPSGGIVTSSLVSCETCRAKYLIPKSADLKKLEALSLTEKMWLAGEARKQFERVPSTPFVIDDAAILAARGKKP
jgi:hypothetical protein